MLNKTFREESAKRGDAGLAWGLGGAPASDENRGGLMRNRCATRLSADLNHVEEGKSPREMRKVP